jgi:hypothetical protein
MQRPYKTEITRNSRNDWKMGPTIGPLVSGLGQVVNQLAVEVNVGKQELERQ